MQRRFRPLLLAIAAAATVQAHAADAPPSALDFGGTWLLVEQTYGKGGSELTDPDAPIRLRIASFAGALTGWIWQGDDPSAGEAWPSLVVNGARLQSTSRTIELDATAATIRAHLRVVPVEGEDLVLDIVESYALTEDRRFLAGTVRVRFGGGDRNRGGYTLHRRFERESR